MSEPGAGKPAHGRIAAEHRSLDSLFGETRTILRSADAGGAARLAISRLMEALESHLAREESLYYPTIWALRPDLKPPLLRLVESHAQFRGLLDAVVESMETRALDDAERRFEEFADLFSQHEGAEEKLLHTLEEEFGASH